MPKKWYGFNPVEIILEFFHVCYLVINQEKNCLRLNFNLKMAMVSELDSI